MAQFSVYRNQNAATSEQFPYLLNVQNDLLDALQTCVVVPLAPFINAGYHAMSRLTPMLTVQANQYLMMTPQLAGIAKRELGEEVQSLAEARHEIISAMDFLLSGV
jgi:toxin CcdB